MSDSCEEKHPADLVLECRQKIAPKGFASNQKKVVRKYCNDKFVEAEGRATATSTVSQEDADAKAVELAVEQADTMIWVKYHCLLKLAKLLGFNIRLKPLSLVNERYDLIAPKQAGWPGKEEKKPWHYKVTAAIPHLETIEPLKMCVEILRRQTERPYILVIDTGSNKETRDQLELLRAPDLEIHYIAAHGYQHSSEPVTVALDVAQALCKTEFIFHTHSDCFLRRFNFIEDMIRMCSPKNPAIGYRMSPRDWITTEWEWMVGHTALVLHTDTINRIGAVWNMRRMWKEYGYPISAKCGGWPDTETGFNHILRDHGIKPHFIGDDINYKRQIDHNIDHVRSYAGATIYSESHLRASAPWMLDALADARDRITQHEIQTLVNEN